MACGKCGGKGDGISSTAKYSGGGPSQGYMKAGEVIDANYGNASTSKSATDRYAMPGVTPRLRTYASESLRRYGQHMPNIFKPYVHESVTFYDMKAFERTLRINSDKPRDTPPIKLPAFARDLYGLDDLEERRKKWQR